MNLRPAIAGLITMLHFSGEGHCADPAPLRVGGKPPAPILNIAHRGARAFAPENTLEAFEKAARLGCHVYELDVHMSKDGELIVVHDDDLVRCSDVKKVYPTRKSYMVSEFTAKEISELDAGSWFVEELKKPADKRQSFLRDLTADEIKTLIPDADMKQYSSGSVRHPTLRQSLELGKKHKIMVNIEIKTMPRMYPDIAAKVVKLIEELGMERLVIVTSFDHEQLAEVRKRSKLIPIGALVGQRLAKPGKYVRDVLDGDSYNPGCYGPYDSLGFNSVTGKLQTDGIKDALAQGVAVHVWTENDPERMKLLIDAGATGIITDYPNRLNDVFKTRKDR